MPLPVLSVTCERLAGLHTGKEGVHFLTHGLHLNPIPFQLKLTSKEMGLSVGVIYHQVHRQFQAVWHGAQKYT